MDGMLSQEEINALLNGMDAGDSSSETSSSENVTTAAIEEELSPIDRKYLKFGSRLENEFFTQGEYENRTIEKTLEIGWDILSELPKEELYRIPDNLIEKYLPSSE